MSTRSPALIIIDNFNHGLLDDLRRSEPSARIMIRTGLDKEIIRSAIGMSQNCMIEDSIFDEYEGGCHGNPEPLSRRHPQVCSSLKKLSCVPPGTRIGPVLFCPSNDTHSQTFLAVSKHLPNTKILHFGHQDRLEKTREFLKARNIAFYSGGPEIIEKIKPVVLVVGNDWSDDTIALIDAAWALRVPTACIQEGALDVGTNMHRMERCHFPLLQGPVMFSLLPHEFNFLTGNPRFDGLEPAPLPARPMVMINSNFTYGIHESDRKAWVESVVEVCKRLGVDYFIAQHPRDTGKFPDFKVKPSGVDSVHGLLRESSILISRFSTLVYEAMLLGRPCIYYNPHGETMLLQAGQPEQGLLKASTPDSLCHLLGGNMSGGGQRLREGINSYIRKHCGVVDGNAARRCAMALEKIARHGYPLLFLNFRGTMDIYTQRMHHRLPRPARRLYQKIRGLKKYPS